MTHAAGRGPHQAPAPLTTDELIDALSGVVREALSPADVRSTADYESLTHTPQGAADASFRQHASALAGALAAAITPDQRNGAELVVSLHFSGVPVSGSVHCAVTVSGGRIDHVMLAEAICEHGAAALAESDKQRVAFALYPPSAADAVDPPV